MEWVILASLDARGIKAENGGQPWFRWMISRLKQLAGNTLGTQRLCWCRAAA